MTTLPPKKRCLKIFFPPAPDPNVKSHDVIFSIVDSEDVISYGALTGKFPYKSSRGNQYILVSYHYDANEIRGVAIKNREAKTITEAYHNVLNYYETRGVKPSKWILDNEVSAQLKHMFEKEGVGFQLVPPKSRFKRTKCI